MLLHGAHKRSFAESAEEPDSASGQDGDNYTRARHSPSVAADLPRASTVASGPAQDIQLDDDGNAGSESASWNHAAGTRSTSVVGPNVASDRANSEALVGTPTSSSKAPTPRNVKRPKYTIPYRRNRNPCVACAVQSVRCEMVDRRPPCTRCCDLDQLCVLKYPGKKPVARPPLRDKMSFSTSQDRRGEDVSQLESPTTTRVSPDQASATTCTRCRTLGIPCIPTRTPRCVECRNKHAKCSLLVRPLPRTMPPIIDPPLIDPPARGSDDSSEDTSSSSDDISDEASVTSAIKDENFEDEDRLTNIPVFGNDGIHSRPGDPVARWPQEGPMAEQVESTTRLSDSVVSPTFLHRGPANPRLVALIDQPSFPSNPLCRQEFLDMWAKCRYVKEGLMSAREILDYFHWFSQHLAPHSKIINLDFLSRDTHEQLLMEDTMLGCSLLTISSRFMTLPHPGGRSRSTYIHSQLWRHCEDFIQHIRKYSHSDSRVLGAIESLLLLSDWLPRSAQQTVDLSSEWSGELICPDLDSHTEDDTGAGSPPVNWKHDVLGPLQRSERLSRRLIRAALNIARVSKIFSDKPPRASDLDVRQAGRQSRIRDLLSIYYIRISCSRGPPFLENGARQAVFGSSNVRIIEPFSDRLTCLWLELTDIMESAGVVFASPSPQMEHVLEGDYSSLRSHWLLPLDRWRGRFDSQVSGMSLDLSCFLLIEFYHLQACLSSLAIQAVVNRAQLQRGRRMHLSSTGRADDAPDVLPTDRELIDQVIHSTLNIFRLVYTIGLGKRLNYAPLRIRICILSATILYLKATSLGGYMMRSILAQMGELKTCITALRSGGIDELDFVPRHAQVLDQHLDEFLCQFAPVRTSAGQMPLSGDEGVARPLDPHIGPCTTDDKTMPLGISPQSMDFLIK